MTHSNHKDVIHLGERKKAGSDGQHAKVDGFKGRVHGQG